MNTCNERQKLSLARTNSQQAIKTIQKLVHEQKNQEQTKLQIASFILIRWNTTTTVRKHYEMNFGWKLGNAVNGEPIPTIIQETFDSSYALCMDH